MTRLTNNNVRNIGMNLEAYDKELVQKTGLTLRELAIRAASPDKIPHPKTNWQLKIFIIPVTSGDGIIPGFVEAIRDIAQYLGLDSFITASTDASGLAEAFAKDANIIFLADDKQFIAINLDTKKVVHNAAATANGYATALHYMAGGLKEKSVFAIGAGAVGTAAVKALLRLGAKAVVYDLDVKKAKPLAALPGVTLENNLDALGKYRLIFDAAPCSALIQEYHIKEDTYIAAPGIPCGISQDAYNFVKKRLIHDPLQIGVATMLFSALI